MLDNLRNKLLQLTGELSTVSQGSVIGGEYVVGDRVGAGGNGVIYTCYRKDEPELLYALKVVRPTSTEAARRFQEEVTAAYEVRHPNVLQSIDCVFHGNSLAYVMEYAAGGDLRDILDRGNVLPIETVLLIGRQLCAGLQAIHDSGIIHRDIKPENILFSKDGIAKIADFGISYNSSTTRITNSGAIVGTINYMSPEYLQTGVFDHRTDIYSIGLILYELVTGRFPFEDTETLEQLILRMSYGVTPPIEFRPDCPLALSNLVLKALYKNPAERYQTAEDMEDDLSEIARVIFGSSVYQALHQSEEQEDEEAQILREAAEERPDLLGFVLYMGIVILIVGIGFISIEHLQKFQAFKQFSLFPTSAPLEPSPVNQSSGVHLVVEGDTVSKIARTYQVSESELMRLNGISDPRMLQVGSQVKIPSK